MFKAIFDSSMKYKIPSYEIRRNRKIFCGLKKKHDELINVWFSRIQNRVNRCEFEKLTEFLLIDKFFSELSEDEIKLFQGTATWSLNQLNEYFSSQNIQFVCVKGEHDSSDGNDDQKSPFQAIEYEDSDHASFQSETNIDIAYEEDEEEQMTKPLSIKDFKEIVSVVPIKREPVNAENSAGNRPELLQNENDAAGAIAHEIHTKTKKSSSQSINQENNTFANEKSSDKRSTVPFAFKKERSSCSKRQRLTCDLCGKSISSAFWLKNHKMKVHGVGSNDYTCDICNKSTSTISGMASHMNIHSKSKSHFCNLCDESFTTRYDLTKHTKYFHLGRNPSNPCTCDICGRTYPTLAKIRFHIYNVHARRYKQSAHVVGPMCDVCGKSFERKYALMNHIESVHNKTRYACDLCHLTYSHKSSLDQHKNTIHRGIRRHFCKVCNKYFGSSNELQKHSVVHSDEKPYVCEFCSKSFKRFDKMQCHVNYAHRSIHSHACNICGKMFKTSGDLKKHTTDIHSGVRKGFACDQCDRAYSQRRNLRTHIKTAHPA